MERIPLLAKTCIRKLAGAIVRQMLTVAFDNIILHLLTGLNQNLVCFIKVITLQINPGHQRVQDDTLPVAKFRHLLPEELFNLSDVGFQHIRRAILTLIIVGSM